jgi:hypothetical protein
VNYYTQIYDEYGQIIPNELDLYVSGDKETKEYEESCTHYFKTFPAETYTTVMMNTSADYERQEGFSTSGKIVLTIKTKIDEYNTSCRFDFSGNKYQTGVPNTYIGWKIDEAISRCMGDVK